jgi:hypothetical protein
MGPFRSESASAIHGLNHGPVAPVLKSMLASWMPVQGQYSWLPTTYISLSSSQSSDMSLPPNLKCTGPVQLIELNGLLELITKLSLLAASTFGKSSNTKVVLIQNVPLPRSSCTTFLMVSYCRHPDTPSTSICGSQCWEHLRPREGIQVSFQFCKSREVWIGIPGKALKLLDTQK